jgi:hypothetical protein
MNIHYLIIGLALVFAIVAIIKPVTWPLAVSVLLICIELFSRVSKAVVIGFTVGTLLACASARAQTVTNTIYVTNSILPANALSTLWGEVKGATNYAIAPYATYAPKAPTKFGGGALLIYNVNQYVGAGAGVDWLGGFSLFSGNLQLKLPMHPLVNYGFPGFEFTPFVLGGLGTPASGAGTANGGLSTVKDIGAQIKFGHFAGGQFSAGATYGTWTGAGPYDVVRYHAFVAWQKGF